MRAVLCSALLLAACNASDSSKVDPAAAADAPGPSSFDRCDSPAGTAALTVSNGTLGPTYARVYAGGVSAGGGDSGPTPPTLELVLLFTNDDLAIANDVTACISHDTTHCAATSLIVRSTFATGAAVGTHDATIENAGGTVSVTGALAVGTYQDPFATPTNPTGHVVGELHVASTTNTTSPGVALDGTFDHTFCESLLESVL